MFTGQRGEAGAPIVQMISPLGTMPLPMRPDLANHSAASFEWGYAGEGPAQLALALCAAVMSDKHAREAYGTVEVKLIAPIDSDHWTLSGAQVLAVVSRNDKKALKPRSNPWPWGATP